MVTYRVTNTPDGDTNTLGDVQAGPGDSDVVVGRGTSNIELSDSDLRDTSAGKGLKGALNTTSTASIEMGLGTNTVDGDTSREPLLYHGDHAVRDLSVLGAVEVVVVDVELGVGVGSAGSLEGDGDELLTENSGKVGVAEAAILSEDLVNDIL
jgi:hypothetical protein